MKNKRKQSKATPYKLEINGLEYGCYANLTTCTQIIMSMSPDISYRVFKGDAVVEESFC